MNKGIKSCCALQAASMTSMETWSIGGETSLLSSSTVLLSASSMNIISSLSMNIMYVTLFVQPTTTVLPQPFYGPFFRDHPGEPVPEENLWTLWCKGRLTEADTATIRLGATPSGLSSGHLHHRTFFLQAGCPSCHPTNSVKALKATCAFRLGRRR